MGHVGPDVEHEAASLQRVEVLREGLPIPRQTLGQRGARDVLDTLQHADQPVVLFGGRVSGGEADAAVAHDQRRDAVLARGSEERVPRGLAVVVGVQVDEPRRHQQSVGIDDLCAAAGVDVHADVGDGPVDDAHVGWRAGSTRPVDDQPVADHELARHHVIVSGPHRLRSASSRVRIVTGPHYGRRGDRAPTRW